MKYKTSLLESQGDYFLKVKKKRSNVIFILSFPHLSANEKKKKKKGF